MCNHEWVYSPDKEKRACKICHATQRRGRREKDKYFDSFWIAHPRAYVDLVSYYIEEWQKNKTV